MIDVGGPSMLRAAAKNFAHVAAVSRPEQYERRAARAARGRRGRRSRRGARSRARRSRRPRRTRRRSRTGSATTEPFPEQLTLAFHKVTDLSYGENPHQAAAYYREAGARRHLLSQVEQLGGKELSYNNLVDLEGARRVMREFALPAVVIVKHANPCGVAVAATIEEAWERALAADPVSAFGCVAILNRPVGARARAADRRALRRGAARARVTTTGRSRRSGRRRRCASWATASGARRRPASATTSACSAACSSRSATRTSRTARRWRSSAARSTRRSGATCSLPGASASTSRRTRSCSRATCRRSASARAR